jgi:hypothetical protein
MGTVPSCQNCCVKTEEAKVEETYTTMKKKKKIPAPLKKKKEEPIENPFLEVKPPSPK